MTDQQIQQKVDNWLTPARLSIFQQKEADFLAAWGKYFQGIETPAAYPVDGADMDPDLTLHPTDQPQDWTNFLGSYNIGKVPASLDITFHDGPSGRGFTLGLRYQNVQNEVWGRSVGSGPYGVTAAWTRLIPHPE